MNLNVYSSSGMKKDTTSLPRDWQEKENLTLLAQAVRVYEDNLHPGLAKTKTRGEVQISTRKIYRQKGTGYARHGAKSAPIFVGGGVAHGPRGLKRKLLLSKKIAKKALGVALSLAIREGRVVVVDSIASLKKSKEARLLQDAIVERELEGRMPKKFTIALSRENRNASQAFRNLSGTSVVLFDDLNAYRVFNGGLILVDKNALQVKSRKGTKSTKSIKRVTEKVLKSTRIGVGVEEKRSGKKAKKPIKSKRISTKLAKRPTKTGKL